MNIPQRLRSSFSLLAAPFASVMLAGGAWAQAPLPSPPPASASPDIRDIRGPLPLESSWLLPALAAGLAVGVGAGAAAWALQRRRKRRVKRPHEIALDRLGDSRALIREGGSREFSIAVSDIVREYIENSFDIIATHQTTHEFLSELLLSSNAGFARNRPILAEFLESCDLAKFGGWNLTLAAMNRMHDSAVRFVAESAAAQALQGTSNSPMHQSNPITTGDTYDSLPTT